MLQFGEYVIDQDEHNYVVTKLGVHGKNSKTPGKPKRTVLAYYPHRELDKALMNVMHRRIAKAARGEAKDVFNALRKFKKEIKEFANDSDI